MRQAITGVCGRGLMASAAVIYFLQDSIRRAALRTDLQIPGGVTLMHPQKLSLWFVGLALAGMMNCSHRPPATTTQASPLAPRTNIPASLSQTPPAMHPDLAGYTPTEQLNSGRVGLTAADIAFYLKVVTKAVQDANAAPAHLSTQPAVAQVKARSRQEMAALKAHDFARFQQLEQQAAAATQALKVQMHAAAFSVQEAGKLGMPRRQWSALSRAIFQVGERLSLWQRDSALQHELGEKVQPFCPARQRPGLSAHHRYRAKDFAILHAACLADQASVQPHLSAIIRLNHAYVAALKQRGAGSMNIITLQ